MSASILDELLARVKDEEARIRKWCEEAGEKTFKAPLRKLDGSRQAYVIVSPAIPGAGKKDKWRATLVDKDGPVTHIERRSFYEVVSEYVDDYGMDLSAATFAQTRSAA